MDAWQLTIDDRAVPIAGGEWEFTETAHGGAEALTAIALADDRVRFQRGAIVAMWHGTQPDEPRWIGKLYQAAQATDGRIMVQAKGPIDELDDDGIERFPFQVLGTEYWIEANDDPFNAGDGHRYDLKHSRGGLGFSFEVGRAYSSGDLQGYAFHFPEQVIRRYSYKIKKTRDTSNFDLRESKFGPEPTDITGGATTINDTSLGGGGPSSRDVTITGQLLEGLALRIRCNGATTPAQGLTVRATDVKVWGRVDTDSLALSDALLNLVEDVPGWGGDVDSDADDILPFDFTGGRRACIEHLCELNQWGYRTSRAEGSWILEAGDLASDVFSVYLTADATAELEQAERYNIVRVPYDDHDYETFAEVVADPDPFPGETVRFMTESLEQSQVAARVAEKYAAAVVAKVSKDRRTGTVRLGRVRKDGVLLPPWKLRAGAALLIADHEPRLEPLPVESVTVRGTGEVEAQLVDDISTDGVLRDLIENARRPRRGKGGRRRGHRDKRRR